VIRLSPGDKGSGFRFENQITGGAIPREFFPAIEKGLRESAERGVISGFQLIDVAVALTDGSFHDVDSSAMAFEIAASLAFREAARKAAPILLEPIMRVEVVTPDDYMGTVIGDLNSRRGRVSGMAPTGGGQAVTAEVPLSAMFGYSTALRSASQGRATYAMEFSHYAPVPSALAEAIVGRL
jgi:elongation factor G